MQAVSRAQVACFLSEAYGRSVKEAEIRPFLEGPQKRNLPDSTLKFEVPSAQGENAFLLISAPGNPRLVARQVANIELARSKLSQPTASRVPLPVLVGEIDHASCAVWTAYKPLRVASRLRGLIRRQVYGPALLNWSIALCAETITQAGESHAPSIAFRRGLERIERDDRFAGEMRRTAAICLERLLSRAWQPRHCLQHGDLWCGNIMLDDGSGWRRDFKVIDWSGSVSNGYPAFDFVCLARSLGLKKNQIQYHLGCFRRVCKMDHLDVEGSVLAGLGHLGANLEYFPEEAYLELASDMFAFLLPFRDEHSFPSRLKPLSSCREPANA